MSNHTHETHHVWVCFVCVVGGGWHQNTKNTHRAHFSCFVMVGGGELPKHEEHTLIGVFFVAWEEGMGGGGAPNSV